MLETIAIPVLTKAVDFLFEECKKILEERRERRKKKETETISPSPIQTNQPVVPGEQPEETCSIVLRDRESALRSVVKESRWSSSADRVAHLLSLLEIHIENYKIFSMQYAKFTDLMVPPYIVHGLESEEKKIVEHSLELQEILSSVYEAKLIVIDPKDCETS